MNIYLVISDLLCFSIIEACNCFEGLYYCTDSEENQLENELRFAP